MTRSAVSSLKIQWSWSRTRRLPYLPVTAVSRVRSEEPTNLTITDTLPLVHPVTKFVSCTTCEDFDLCIPCHVNLKHGHHPGHTFRPATTGVTLDGHAAALCPAGRNMIHYAFCDGCDKVSSEDYLYHTWS